MFSIAFCLLTELSPRLRFRRGSPARPRGELSDKLVKPDKLDKINPRMNLFLDHGGSDGFG
jgi:hypothetical protein